MEANKEAMKGDNEGKGKFKNVLKACLGKGGKKV
jgi:hypothetical protein